jgi:hypothetical protein
MKQWLLRGLLGLSLAALGIWGWRILFPSPEQAIRKQLTALAQTASVPASEGALAKLARAQRLTGFFTSNVEITVDLPGRSPQTITGRDELQQVALGARSMAAGLKVAFLDVGVTLAPDRQSAVAHLTARADVPGERMPQVQELSVSFQNLEHDWLISRVEAVRTLR